MAEARPAGVQPKREAKLLTVIRLTTMHAKKGLQFQKNLLYLIEEKKGKRNVQGVPQSQTAALPRPQEEEETDKSKQAQTEQTYEKH